MPKSDMKNRKTTSDYLMLINVRKVRANFIGQIHLQTPSVTSIF